MDAGERQLVTDQLAASRERLLELVQGLTPEQWAFQPPGLSTGGGARWSIGECLEHVIRVENRILGLIGKKISEGAPEPEKMDPAHSKDAVVANMLPDRTIRREAPEPARPTGLWPDSNDLLAEFRKTRRRTAEFAATTDSNLRSYFLPHMALGELDCYQWLLVLSLHGSRHALQIEEIKAVPDFPASAHTARPTAQPF